MRPIRIRINRCSRKFFYPKHGTVSRGISLKVLCDKIVVGLLLSVFLISPLTYGAEVTELMHDNDKPSANLSLPGGIAYGVTFSPPSASWPIRRVRIFGLLSGKVAEGPGQDVTIEIWTMNGTTLHSSVHSYKKFKTAPNWVYFNIDGPDVSESFRVVVYAPGIPNVGGILVYYDLSLSSSYSDTIVGRRILTNWNEIAYSQNTLSLRSRINWMIRVCSTSVAEATTTTTTASQSSIPFLGSFDMSRIQQIGGVAATAGTALFGYFFKTRKRRLTSGYLNKIESVVKDQSKSPEERKQMFGKIRQEVLDLLKKGKIEETQFSMLDSQLREYMKEIT